MSFPVALPDWLPWWAVTLAVIPALVYLLLFLIMPFSVFGLKDRLDLLDARLDEIQQELRMLTLRQGSPARQRAETDDAPPAPPPPPPPRPARAEPRLNWPR